MTKQEYQMGFAKGQSDKCDTTMSGEKQRKSWLQICGCVQNIILLYQLLHQGLLLPLLM